MEQNHFAIIYQDLDRARLALQTLRKLHLQRHINLKEATAVTRYEDGQFGSVAFREAKPGMVRPKYGLAGLAGTIAGMIGAAPLGPAVLVMAPFMGAVGTSAAIGYDWLRKNGTLDSLRQTTQASMPESSSAIIVRLEIINLDETLPRLARLGKGELIQDDLSPALDPQLVGALAISFSVS